MAGGARLWLADLLAAVLVRAAETEAPSVAHPSVPPWPSSWTAFATLLTDHLSTLKVHASSRPNDAHSAMQEEQPVMATCVGLA